ncbi:beta-glucosidase [Gracilibacillus halophilus YIM-C55.5]|uniref:Beta-glucosidase n=1 Tax=Gracilibacillus halophilus YIM-C55.5 TaxID=1308866 RepID=N4WA06_9BACI|nr:glycoside hydrolase family 3 N-terminal domain-containing protein [Gracilibacillus halophilus]ENH96079.1 beta-glucosidase [Gracilibacillus halophilus YIM-C55.5]
MIGTAITVSFVSVPEMVKILLIGVIILAIGIVIFGFIWARKHTPKRKGRRRVLFALLSVGLIAIIVLNGAVYNYHVVINQYLTKVDMDEEELAKVTEDARGITEKIEDEGIVLLENKNNALPLNQSNETETNINVFGQASVKMVYGGSGSGSGDESENVTLQQGLENAGFNVNDELTEFYEEHKPEEEEEDVFNLDGGDYRLSEPATSDFSEEMLTNAEEFSDVALITLSRAGGEGGDLPFETSEYGGTEDRHYLEISEAEETMIEMVKEMDFEKVVVMINSSHAMELEFLEDEGIDAAMVIGGPGSTGNNSVGKVLAGTVNPSGRLVNTYAYDATSSPAYYNAGDFKYSNTEHTSVDKFGEESQKYHTFLNYQEGIYVGYRYYETRYVDNQTGEVDEEAYENAVQYPFGYGLSYTDFTQEITNYQSNGDTITVDVEVTNTGNEAGKEVVQVYYTPPYDEGGIEKSHVELGAFDKTEMLEPGSSETVTLEIAAEDMASYDYQNEEAYVLEEGTYDIKLMNNAHDVLDTREYEVGETIVYNEGNKRASDQVVATNQFEDAQGDIQYVSRADWEGTLPTQRTQDKEASPELVEALETNPIEDNPEDEDITFADHGLELADMKGLDYDDPKWQDLLEQISVDEMARLIGYGGYETQEVESINKPATTDLDGPAGINDLLSGVNGVQYMTEVVLGSTWNVDLAEKMGEYLANEATVYGVSGIYAPAMNIHRTPFSGRNFEYYSEDPFISGKMGAATVKGAMDQGVYTYIKHYALNDQETNRDGVAVWSNEQAIREIYLKAFELPVKEGGSTAIMSSFNRLGTLWAGDHYGLLTTVLRDEWGFEGMVITDWDQFPHMSPDSAIRAGNDLMLTTLGDEPTELSTETNTGRQAMRQATHNILYTVANSNALEINQKSYPNWLLLLGLGDIILLTLLSLGFYKLTHRKNKQADAVEKVANQ